MRTATFRHLLTSFVVASIFLLGMPHPAAASENDLDEVRGYIEALRSDVNSAKISVLNQAMKLTGSEAEKFWPVYRRYEQELAVISNKRLEIIRDFAPLHFAGGLDAKSANKLAGRWLQNNQERLNLWKKYQKKISRAVSPIRAAQFLQVENQMAIFIDLNIASEMPIIGSTQTDSAK